MDLCSFSRRVCQWAVHPFFDSTRCIRQASRLPSSLCRANRSFNRTGHCPKRIQALGAMFQFPCFLTRLPRLPMCSA